MENLGKEKEGGVDNKDVKLVVIVEEIEEIHCALQNRESEVALNEYESANGSAAELTTHNNTLQQNSDFGEKQLVREKHGTKANSSEVFNQTHSHDAVSGDVKQTLVTDVGNLKTEKKIKENAEVAKLSNEDGSSKGLDGVKCKEYIKTESKSTGLSASGNSNEDGSSKSLVGIKSKEYIKAKTKSTGLSASGNSNEDGSSKSLVGIKSKEYFKTETKSTGLSASGNSIEDGSSKSLVGIKSKEYIKTETKSTDHIPSGKSGCKVDVKCDVKNSIPNSSQNIDKSGSQLSTEKSNKEKTQQKRRKRRPQAASNNSASKDNTAIPSYTSKTPIYQNTKLTPYQGKDKTFGLFFCSSCIKEWASPHTWANCFQICKDCGSRVYPWRQYPLLRSSNKKKQKPHPQDLCQKCAQLGFFCGSKKKGLISLSLSSRYQAPRKRHNL